jgi:hypothetical protein
VAAVPLDGSLQPFLEAYGGFPIQLFAHFAAIDRIPAIVPWAVFHKLDLILGLSQDFSYAVNIPVFTNSPTFCQGRCPRL